MNFEWLEYRRFGSLTDVRLDLGAPGVHLVIGPNEGGKSTALDGLSDLLYGFERRTRHDHFHPAAELELAAGLRDGSGQITVVRRKRGATLTDAKGVALDPGDLAPFLHGVDRQLFTTLFAISLEELATGSEHLLATQGDVARALFGASTGRAELQSVLSRLDSRAGELYIKRGSKPAINAGLSRLTEAKARVARDALPPATWTATIQEAAALQQELDDRRAAEAGLRQEDRIHRRLRSALPILSRRADADARRQELLPSGPRLDSATRLLVDEASDRQRASRRDQVRSEDELARLDREIAALSPDEESVRFATQIGAVQANVGAYSAWLVDVPDVKARLTHCIREAETLAGRLLPDLPLDTASAAVGPVLGARDEIELRAHEGTELALRARQAGNAVSEARTQLREAERVLAQLSDPVDAEALGRAVRSARALGSPDTDREDRVRVAERHHHVATALIGRIGLNAEVTEVDRVPVPDDSCLHRHQETLARLEEELRSINQRVEDLVAEQNAKSDERAQLITGGRLPTLKELMERRDHRESLWQTVCRVWRDSAPTGGEEAVPGREELGVVYEQAVVAADQQADDLRDHADIAGQLRALDDHLGKLASEEERLGQRRIRLAQDRQAADKAWHVLWAPTGVVPPASVDNWRRDLDAACKSARSWREEQGELTRLETVVADASEALLAALDVIGRPAPVLAGGFAGLLAYAEGALAELTTSATRRVERQQTVAGLQSRLGRTEQELASVLDGQRIWVQQWKALVERVGMPASITPDGAREWLATAAELEAAVTARDQTDTDLRRLVERIDRFEREVAALVDALDPTLVGGDPRSTVDRLYERLTKARDAGTRLTLLTEARGRESAQQTAALSAATAAEGELSDVGRRHDLEDEQALVLAVARSIALDDLDQVISEQEQLLLAQGDGLSVEALAAAAGAWTPESLDAELDRIAQALADLAPVIEDLARRRTELAVKLTQWRGGDDAAAAATEAQQVTGEVAELIREFALKRMARELLGREIERHRQSHEEPILSRAGTIFARLTGDMYVELIADLADDEGRLHARRRDGAYIGVEGLSDGARDELWFALRVAALECWPAERGFLPVIFDDTFSAFDQDRAGAAFAVLAELSARFQVVMFTHHDHLEEVARAAVPTGQLHVHRLARFDPTLQMPPAQKLAAAEISEGPIPLAS